MKRIKLKTSTWRARIQFMSENCNRSNTIEKRKENQHGAREGFVK